MKMLVGYTGFVGSNLMATVPFEKKCNSRNIKEAYGTKPELLIFAGLRAEKYLANIYPENDLKLVKEAFENIKRIQPKKLVLISTVDVYKHPENVNEDSLIVTEGLQPYGLHRYLLEKWVRELLPDSLIVRLPALYGRNIKKNFVYDCINMIPFKIKVDKFEDINQRFIKQGISLKLENYYEKDTNDFFQCKILDNKKKWELREIFEKFDFNALSFTDSRSVFQFYPLSRLWIDINIAIDNNIFLWIPATEPISASEIYYVYKNKRFINEIQGEPFVYNCKTIYAELFGGENGYIMNKKQVLSDLKIFMKRYSE